jgi:hypothetical protein
VADASTSWWVISDANLLALLNRSADGEDPDLLMAEEYANASHDRVQAGPTDAQVLAALQALGWPDDRDGSAHVEDDGYQVTPARHYWDTVTAVVQAVLDAGRQP